MEHLISSYKPFISRRGFLFIASLFWFTAGILLNQRGLIYILEFSRHILFHVFVGVGGGVLFFLIIFYHISNKYTKRIVRLKTEKLSAYCFRLVLNFTMMGLFIFLGLCLRRYGIADRLFLSIIYVAIGFSLIFGSFKFLYSFIRFNKIETSELEIRH
jgi:hypothetical protein